MFYSKSTGGFYAREIHGDNIPEDVVEITADEHAELMAGQAAGKVIVPNVAGKPILANQPAPTPEQAAAAVAASRQAAYAKESDPLFFKAQRGEGTMEEWMAKVAEIKARYPYGVLPV